MSENQEKQEIMVYGNVPWSMRLDDKYLTGSGLNPTPGFIARQYDCTVEYREATFKKDPCDGTCYFHGAQDGDTLTAMVLVGEDRAKLVQARDDMIRTFGGKQMNPGRVCVSDRS